MTPSTLAWLAGAGVRRAFREGGAAEGGGAGEGEFSHFAETLLGVGPHLDSL